jgi:two-component system, NtrC family, sensor kinase
MVRKLINYFIPVKINGDHSELRDRRIFISVILISALFNLLGIKTAWDLEIYPIVYMLLFNAFFSIVILYFYKNGLSKKIAGNLFLLQFEVTFIAQAWLQGGILSPASAAFFLLPAIAMLILGKKEAFFWIVFTCVTLTLLYITENYIGAPTITYPLTRQKELFFYSVIATNLAIYFVLLVYENGKNKAIKELAEQHKNLVSAQDQLIQQEKLISLAQLTAGIAHEIQNPLNFVNNFSELNIELISELNEELKLKNYDEVQIILKSVLENLEKIGHHGKRADSIVKGMLMHSRSSSGAKELTDINALAEEYIRLCYHGLRAKDKTFNATINTDFDNSIGKINVVPQDIGRVILNLLTNAFYAITERKDAIKNSQGTITYEPTVSISTKNLHDKIEIIVSDNGNGIPQSVIDKIFQPFFTTKPTGQGTGLGLSLSYDIVKSHGGSLTVKSKESDGTTFTIILPNNL